MAIIISFKGLLSLIIGIVWALTVGGLGARIEKGYLSG